ncbi:Acetylpolyamine amidohydrolase [Bosea sp. 62]|uniref:histone deacetylase family protein n=1 Tax=unclassified Bosea (in: a-proteobacteria) TaxID=2653178 RepID=UPI001256C60B|nr:MULTISPECIES: histone deacetylase family protein [unclassified Bosea (in: a-proteobacteria)]CAD5251159.1 Acetylpolyamine amidohydrolase [Bosea sp. 7B]CAD5280983.1 Acetylpolyamine amidohydrolase [Bosea sp. 21B]CAD5282136.1 Acetylpolyamine amidohydrolase [Bosea sp. 46]VVT59366.1 Acetylpolyamine amidohydrolase [Bosea sp. EC-HK365B]VXB26147.1 Acetylpolyamine amidohydrolase [Bosea sp. 62]
MQVVWSATQLAHRETRFVRSGEIVPSPETAERATFIRDALVRHSHSLIEPREIGLAPILAVHDADFVSFLQGARSGWSAFAGPEAAVMPNVHPRGPDARRPSGPVGQLGWYTGDMACEITDGTWQAACAAAQGATTAAQLVAEGARSVYALCRPPGHHAGSDRAMGFCYLNNAAIAAQELRRSFDRVAILDVDVHHGNGTQEIFYGRGDVYFASIHGDPDQYYPFYWGYADQAGEGEGLGATLNVPFPVGSGDGPFLDALATALAGIRRFAPQALVLSLGVDASIHDPHGRHAVSDAGFRQMAALIAGLELPTAIVQEGGYASAELGETVADILDILG